MLSSPPVLALESPGFTRIWTGYRIIGPCSRVVGVPRTRANRAHDTVAAFPATGLN